MLVMVLWVMVYILFGIRMKRLIMFGGVMVFIVMCDVELVVVWRWVWFLFNFLMCDCMKLVKGLLSNDVSFFLVLVIK